MDRTIPIDWETYRVRGKEKVLPIGTIDIESIYKDYSDKPSDEVVGTLRFLQMLQPVRSRQIAAVVLTLVLTFDLDLGCKG